MIEVDFSKNIWSVKVWATALVAAIFMVLLFNWLTKEAQKDARFVYIFPDGMRPIDLVRDYPGEIDDVWLCENESGQYIECSPWSIIDNPENREE